MLVVRTVQLLIGRGLGPPDAMQHHLDQFAAAHADLTQQGEQQSVVFAGLGIANRNHRRLGSQSSAGRAQNYCTWPDRSGSESLQLTV
jgi:hypothetical protein